MKISVFAALFLALAGPAFEQPATGSYVAKSIDSRPLPAEFKLATSAGSYRWLRLDQAVLRLHSGGKFTVSYRYYEQQLPVGKRPSGAKLMTETQQGSYTVQGRSIVLNPAKPKSGNRAPRTSGEVSSKGITLPYNLRDGKVVKRHLLLLVLDPTYW
jgi:hypothetical protein